MRRVLPLSLASAAVLAALALSGCADSGSAPAVSDSTSTATASAEIHASSPISLDGGWAKASADMSGVFGTLQNHSDTDLTLVSATSTVAGMVELHESQTSGSTTTMREVDGGFTLPAGGSFTLEPGGNHIMLMELPAELLPGDEVPLTLTFDDDTTLDVTVLVKDFGGAQENYTGESDDSHAEH